MAYVACDALTRLLISVLLWISDTSSDLASRLRTEEQEDGGRNERCLRFSSMFFAVVDEMSSVASKHALLIALGGFSIAALFVWYIKKKDSQPEDRNKKAKELVETNGSLRQNGHAVQSSRNRKDTSKQDDDETTDSQEDSSEISSLNETPLETVVDSVVLAPDFQEKEELTAAEDSAFVENKKQEDETKSERIETVPIVEKSKEIEIGSESDVIDQPNEQKEGEEEQQKPVEEEIHVKKENTKLKSAPIPPLIEMPSKKKVLEHEQIPEEPTPTKMLDTPLSLDITAQMSPAGWSWSEEMENSREEEMRMLNESSDIDRSPASPIRPMQHQQQSGKKSQQKKKGGKGGKDLHHHHPNHHQHHHSTPQNQQRDEKHRKNVENQTQVKKGQRRLTGQRSVEESHQPQHEKENQKPKRGGVNHHDSGDVEQQQKEQKTIEHQSPIQEHPEEEVYEKSGSPGVDSQNSEVLQASSDDSGRVSGPHAGSLSPVDPEDEENFLPMYEFEIPNSLVGLIIGVKGKTIKELSMRTNVRMLIRQHHATDKVKTHQICQVRGKRDEINHCLQMLRRRFPLPRFPELNLQPVVPPVMPNNNFDMLSTQPTWLTLPEEIKCEIAVSSIISPSHFFIQQPTHPSFASLRHLDMYMGSLYGEHSNLPELPIPCQNGLLCAAAVGNSWFRAVTVQYYEDTDEVFVKFVDYGGYSKISRRDLRQIRTDLMSLPFQSTEVMLANVRPIDGTANWNDLAMEKFRKLCTGRVINSKVVGYSIDTHIPMVELYFTLKDKNGDNMEVRFDELLLNEGLARTADPSKMTRPASSALLMPTATKRPSLASQTSQTTVVC